MSGTKQHYLQRAYLHNFASRRKGKTHYILSFNKFTQAIEERDVYQFCHERYFYDFTDDDGKVVPIDEMVIKPLEDELLPPFQEVCRNPTLEVLNKNRQGLARFVAFVILRSAVYRANEKDILAVVAEMEPDLEVQGTAKNDYKWRHYEYFEKAFDPTWRRLYSMDCRLLFNPGWKRMPFWTSDKAYLLPGVGVDGYSSAGTLLGDEVQWNTDATLLNRLDAELLLAVRPNLMLSFRSDAVHGTLPKLMHISEDYVRAANEGQVRGCIRYVFSPQNNFQLAKDLLRRSPEYGDVNRRRVRPTLDDADTGQ